MLVVEKVRAGTVIVMMNGVVVLPEGSFTVTVIGYDPGVVGLPAIVLSEVNSPGGILPEIDHTGAEQVVPLQVAEKLKL